LIFAKQQRKESRRSLKLIKTHTVAVAFRRNRTKSGDTFKSVSSFFSFAHFVFQAEILLLIFSDTAQNLRDSNARRKARMPVSGKLFPFKIYK